MEKLNIWLIKEGEALPLNEDVRLMRTGSLAKYLAEQGHKVIWWSSTFIHGEKKYICHEYREVAINENEQIIMLHSPIAYRKNISVERILYHKFLAIDFLKKSKRYQAPDIILCSWPTPQFAQAAIKYGKKMGIPVIIDIRDLWPDVFEKIFPKGFKFLSSILLYPLKKSTKKIMSAATGIVGKEDRALCWGCNYANREIRETDRRIFIGGARPCIAQDRLNENLKWWNMQGVIEENWNICFFSTLSKRSLDLETVIRAVISLAKKYPHIHLIIGGKGDGENYYRSLVENTKNVHIVGWLNQEQMNSLMAISKCGVYCLRNTKDFKDTFTNKAVQYLSGGLPLINSLEGFSKDFIEINNIGMTYKEGSEDNCVEIIEAMYLDEENRKNMTKSAIKVFENYFEESVVNSQFENYLCELINKKDGSKRMT